MRPAAYEQRRLLPTLVAGVLLGVPLLIHASLRTYAPCLVGLCLALYACIFLLVFYVLPGWIKERFGIEYARRWRYAALNAAFCMTSMTLISLMARLPLGPFGLRMGLATLAMVVSYTLLGWLMVRHFPDRWPWRNRRR